MTAIIYLHPTMTSSPGLIQALQERLGMRAVVEGHRVRMIGPARLTGRPIPQSPPTTAVGRPRFGVIRGRS